MRYTNNMNLITKGVVRFSAFIVINALLDVYVLEKEIDHYINFGVAIVVAVALTYLDYRELKKQKEQNG